jgi:glutathione S-transferase
MTGEPAGDAATLVIGNRNYSSWSLRAWFFLARSGVRFTTLRLPLDTVEFRRRIGDFSPSRRVPVLLDGERRIWDSLAICEYAAERFAGVRAWPDDVSARAFARSISCEMHAGFAALRGELPLNCRALGRRVTPSDAARRDIDRVLEIWLEARTRYGHAGPWLCGEFGIADAMYAPVALRFRTYGVPVAGAPAEWLDTVVADPVMLRWLEAAAGEPEVIAAEERG